MTMMITDLHHQYNHQGVETVVNEVRQKYHVSSIRSLAKKVFAECQRCKNNKASPRMPEMVNLPNYRLQPYMYPFSKTGVDYFGPIEVTVRRSREKRYGIIFTCMSTRAIHLELAGSISTDSCIMAIRRFISRRGQPVEFYSDNGTNFKGADAEMKKYIAELNQQRLEDDGKSKGI
jgi:transposase InsO family protein